MDGSKIEARVYYKPSAPGLYISPLVLRSKSNKGVIPGAGRNGHMFVLHWCYFRAQTSLCRDSPILVGTDNNDTIIRLGRPFNTKDLKAILNANID
jgi:hypothetical protein